MLGAALTATVVGFVSSPSPSNALVKGVAPPPKKKSGEKSKCTNVEECQAMAEQREAEQRAREEAGPPPLVTKGGVKYRDLELGDVVDAVILPRAAQCRGVHYMAGQVR